jgi:flavin-binding protein dodecin
MKMIAEAFEELVEHMTAFEAAWLHDGGRTTVRALIDDALLKASASLALLEPAHVVEEVEYLRTHETYRSVLKIGMFLSQYVRAGRDVPADALARARGAVDGMLDALTPYVLRKDHALRRVLIDNVPFDDAVAQLALVG